MYSKSVIIDKWMRDLHDSGKNFYDIVKGILCGTVSLPGDEYHYYIYGNGIVIYDFIGKYEKFYIGIGTKDRKKFINIVNKFSIKE
jgi:hypothetical protein